MFTIERTEHIATVWLDRPDKLNAMGRAFWDDLPAVMAGVGDDETVRVVVLAGKGKAFSVGLDLVEFGPEMAAGLLGEGSGSSASRAAAQLAQIKHMQRAITAVADCPKPVIAAVHGYCLGAGIDLITACDIRLSTSDAVLGIRETKMGLVADVGTMQRLPKLIAPGHLAELVYTGNDFSGAEAERIGLVNRTYDTSDEVLTAAGELAARIAANSSLVVQGAKAVLRAEENMTTEQALDHIALWNTSFLMSNDLLEAMSAHMEKRPPNYTGS